ncbi:MAG: hypothetical protein HC781_01425 [Leptolyngbyaceae cyanobacterium CSU_1_4]|nr:hypothetical protein [Leptolyngbyaceae cyanobacterium CSU_1_4]
MANISAIGDRTLVKMNSQSRQILLLCVPDNGTMPRNSTPKIHPNPV